jgi:aspartate racemase
MQTQAPASVPARRLGGVLGGMGPMATVNFLTQVIALTRASRDQEHVPLVVHQVPQIPDRSTAILAGSDAPFAPMLEGLRRLAAAGADFAVIPCNSAHHWYDRLANSQPLKILHIADAVSSEIKLRAITSPRLAVLATRGALRSGIYAGRLGDARMVTVEEAAQQLIDQAIAAVKAGQQPLAARLAEQAVEQLMAAGAQTLILACTDLSVALQDSAHRTRCIDSTMALARLCVAESTG